MFSQMIIPRVPVQKINSDEAQQTHTHTVMMILRQWMMVNMSVWIRLECLWSAGHRRLSEPKQL